LEKALYNIRRLIDLFIDMSTKNKRKD